MAIKVKPLSDTKCASAKPRDKDYYLHDGDGLFLVIRTSGTKSWQFKYKNKTTNKPTKLSEGSYPALSLNKARERRATYKRMLAEGLDPKEQKTLQNVKLNSNNTLESITRAWLHTYAMRKPLDENTKHKRLRKFENHLFPKFKNRVIDQIKLSELKNALNKIYECSTDNAQRIRADLVLIFGYAKQHNLLEVNIARELDDMQLSGSGDKHRATFEKGELHRIPLLIKRIKADTGNELTKLCLLVALHTFLRSSEIRYARWDEIDFENKEWRVPAKRKFIEGIKHSDRGTKLKREHLVPLSPQVIEILKQVYVYSGCTEYVFPCISHKIGFLSENTPNNALRRMGYSKEEMCIHGFRALARTSLGEMAIFQREALETQMSHLEQDKKINSYTHIAEYLEERRKIMNTWSAWLEKIESQSYVSPYTYAQSIYDLQYSRKSKLLMGL